MLRKLLKTTVAMLLGFCGAMLSMLGLMYETEIRRSRENRARD